eukprot:2475313-Rhodomonas_salina.1
MVLVAAAYIVGVLLLLPLLAVVVVERARRAGRSPLLSSSLSLLLPFSRSLLLFLCFSVSPSLCLPIAHTLHSFCPSVSVSISVSLALCAWQAARGGAPARVGLVPRCLRAALQVVRSLTRHTQSYALQV